jgi:hypothetical protein
VERAIWISYDFGVRGDYEGIYTWLDNHGAIECGDSIAFLSYEFSGDLIQALKKDIKDSVDVTKKTRLYVIWRDLTTKKIKGRFILGTRKSPPWTGYARGEEEVEDGES